MQPLVVPLTTPDSGADGGPNPWGIKKIEGLRLLPGVVDSTYVCFLTDLPRCGCFGSKGRCPHKTQR